VRLNAYEQILHEFKDWIIKHSSKIIITPKQHITNIDLRAINQIWQINYIKTASSQLRGISCKGISHNTLTLYGAIDDIERTHLWLQKWLKQRAKEILIPWLQQLSVQHNLPFNKVSIRGQQTLWGSCSPEHDISLNYKLLFLSNEKVTHILLHELCHTKHLNHSQRFWALLSKLDPNCKINDNAIRKADKLIDIF
jgi:predicted metal-dependent hydrolase